LLIIFDKGQRVHRNDYLICSLFARTVAKVQRIVEDCESFSSNLKSFQTVTINCLEMCHLADFTSFFDLFKKKLSEDFKCEGVRLFRTSKSEKSFYEITRLGKTNKKFACHSSIICKHLKIIIFRIYQSLIYTSFTFPKLIL
jgi:hypothetical protein